MEQELRRSPRRLRRCEHCIWTDLVGWDLQSFWKAYFLQYSLGKLRIPLASVNSRWEELITKSSTEFGIKHYSTVNRVDVSQYMHVWLVQVTLLNMQMRWASVRIHFWLALRFLKKINEMTWFIVHCFERRESWNEVYMFWICLSARKSSLTTRLFPGARRVKFPGLEPGLSAQRAMGLPQTNCSSYLFLAN